MSCEIRLLIMRLIELELYKHSLLLFSAIAKITYTPKNDTQVIIGSNGSGKSSLMAEISPLPTEKRFMLDDGYKKYHCEHKGKYYTLLATYGKHRKCSFIEHCPDKGDIELNDGGTTVAQKILIEKVFGLDVNLLKIWLGKTRFTSMPALKRRDWILKLSGSDLEFAMMVYNRFKSEVNEAKSVERHFIKRLSDEMNDKIDPAEVERLEDEVASITGNINRLMIQKDNSLPSQALTKLNATKLIAEFHAMSDEALGMHLVKPNGIPPTVTNRAQLREFATGVKEQLNVYAEQLEELYEQKKTVDDAVEALSSNGVTSTEELNVRTNSLREELQVLKEQTPIYEDFEGVDPNQLMGRYLSIKSTLIEALSELPDNSDGRITKENGNIARVRIDGYVSRSAEAERRRTELLHRIEHFQNTSDVNCPKCDHSFKPGVLQLNLEECQTDLNAYGLQITADEQKLKQCREYLEEYDNYVFHVNQIKRIMRDNEVLQPLWNLLYQDNLYKVAPLSHMALIQTFEPLLENCISINALTEQIAVNETVLKSVETLEGSQANQTATYVKTLEDKIESIIAKRTMLDARLKTCNEYGVALKRKGDLINRLFDIRGQLDETLNTLVLSTANAVINEKLGIEQVKLASASNALNTFSRHDAVINDIKLEKDKASHQLKVNTALMNAISPSNGLISKYIQNFLNVFLEDVNIVINAIWTTPLEILPCAVDSTDVNCKFPLSVNGGACISEDISECSDGQRDIIDFSFRRVIGLYLDLGDYPLMLDELAPTLDEQHRINIIRYLVDLMETNQFEQMFMISHYAANHYAFGNSEILMMDGRNILEKPANYNCHVKFEYDDSLMKS